MILCYSGTGNSLYAAEILANSLGDEVMKLNDLIRDRDFSPMHSEKPYVFVCPIYAWRIPRVVQEYILSAELRGNRRVYFAVTCYQEAGSAPFYAKRLCKRRGMEFMGMGAVRMPENLLTLFKVPDEDECDRMISDAAPVVRGMAATIRMGLPLNTGMPGGIFRSAVLNPLFFAFVKPRRFHVTDRCDGCNNCAEVCPLGNISLEDGFPVWGNRCTMCTACINGCHVEAIEYGGKTKGKRRYTFRRPPA